jgi:hypothetical protein
MLKDPVKSEFKETGADVLDPGKREILSRHINELALKIQGTKLEAMINKLYLELESKGILFKPKCYLSDEWGCPHGIPVIGIPFYLADNELSKLEGELTGIEAENDEEIMMYLRHEAGHAINYAYQLYLQPEWRSLFGLFSHPYQEIYKPKPFSPRFVRHIPGWYAQKHPDEDFAETFAVWLTPNSNWRKVYADTPVLTKLLYVERLSEEYGKKQAPVTDDTLDSPVEELTDTLADWYQTDDDLEDMKAELPSIIDEDLKTLFSSPAGHSAIQFILQNRRKMIQNIHHWTGLDEELIESLVGELARRVELLNLKIDQDQTEEKMIGFTVFATTLVMNYVCRDSFVKL